MILSISVQPGERIYWVDMNDGSTGEEKVLWCKVELFNTGIEISYRRKDDILDSFICTEREISERIPRDGVLYFNSEHVRDAYRNKIMKKVKK